MMAQEQINAAFASSIGACTVTTANPDQYDFYDEDIYRFEDEEEEDN